MPQEKKYKRYFFYKVYCLIVFFVWNAAGLWLFFRGRLFQDAHYMFWSLPFLVPALFMIAHVGVYPLKYSVLGPYERTPFPAEKPLLEEKNIRGGIGWCYFELPFFSCSIYNTGIGIAILGLGKSFIPFENILSIKVAFSGFKIIHDNPEVRSPVAVSSEKIRAALKEAESKRNKKWF